METNPHSLTGLRILIVEDEYFMASDLVGAFERAGAEVVGPASNVDDALDLVEDETNIDGAVLDVNLQGDSVYPVADALRSRGVPFVFATGYDASAIAEPYREVVRCEKPVEPRTIVAALFGKL